MDVVEFPPLFIGAPLNISLEKIPLHKRQQLFRVSGDSWVIVSFQGQTFLGKKTEHVCTVETLELLEAHIHSLRARLFPEEKPSPLSIFPLI